MIEFILAGFIVGNIVTITWWVLDHFMYGPFKDSEAAQRKLGYDGTLRGRYVGQWKWLARWWWSPP